MRIQNTLAALAVVAAVSATVQAQGFGFAEDCPAPTPAIEDLLGATRTLCTGDTQGLVSHPASAGTLLVDEQRALRGFIGTRDEKALVFQGAVAHHGSLDDTIFWGTWMSGAVTEFEGERASRHDRRSTSPYVAGVAPDFYFRQDVLRGQVRSALPATGIVDYRLLGRPVVSSEGNVTMPNADNDRQPIDPGPVENATLRVDFSNGTGVADITFAVRGVRTPMRIPLQRQGRVGSTWDADCDRLPAGQCPQAELRLYGRQGEFAGLLLRFDYNSAMGESGRVAARLTNARGTAGIALRREQ